MHIYALQRMHLLQISSLILRLKNVLKTCWIYHRDKPKKAYGKIKYNIKLEGKKS